MDVLGYLTTGSATPPWPFSTYADGHRGLQHMFLGPWAYQQLYEPLFLAYKTDSFCWPFKTPFDEDK